MITLTLSLSVFTGGKPLPSDDVLNALFSRLMVRPTALSKTIASMVPCIYIQDKMNLPPERVAELNMRRREYKWSLILAQV